MKARLAGAVTLASIFGLVLPSSSTADFYDTDVTYTTDADFDLGTSVSVNHDAPFNDQLQLDSPTRPFPFINVAASGRGTVVRVDTETGEVLGEYRTAPEGYGLDPSRTTVDLFGNVWTGNREEVGEIEGVAHGSAVKIGLVVGGTRVDATGEPDPTGGYLAPPYGYSTCADRDGDGLLRTSSGLLDVLDWPDVTDGLGGSDGTGHGIVEDAVDECILLYQRLPDAEAPRHLSVDANNDVWVGGFPFDLRMFHLLDGTTGAIIDSFDAREIGCGGYGGLVDGNGVLWSIGWGWGEGPLLRYDPATGEGTCVNTFGGYGLGIDTNGYVWASIWENGIAKVAPDGTLEPGYPTSTWLPPAPPTPFASTASATFERPATASLQPTAQLRLARMPAAFLTALAPVDGGDFWAAPDDDWIGSMSPWTPGTTVTMTIDDGSGVVYAADQTVDGDGNFNFNLWDVFDLQRGHIVTISDDDTIPTTKVHTVLDLFVDGIDVTADTVFGRAAPGSAVDVWVHDPEVGTTATADGSGNWTADFSGSADLTYASDGGSSVTDDDGDATGVWWAGPAFAASPDDDWVASTTRWTLGATVSMTIEDGSGVVYSDSQTVDERGTFNFNLRGLFDLQRGHTVTVSDGATTKVHVVTDLDVTDIDIVADTVSGVATPGRDVHVWDHQDDANVTVTPDGLGNWTADFSGRTDLTGGSDGNSQQTDDDGDATQDFWSLPRFTASPDDDWVAGWNGWRPGATVSMTIEDGSGVVYADSQVAAGDGNFNFNLWDVFDLQRGHTITVSDGTTTKVHTVIDLLVDGVDPTADTVFGRAPADAAVDVWTDLGVGITPVADGAGDWLADFSGLTDLTYRSNGEALTADDDGDTTTVWWAGATFAVSPDHDWIGSTGRWTPGATVNLSIVGDGGYADSQMVDERGQFQFHLGGAFDVARGHVVTVSDGTTTKTHAVIDLFADGVNPTTDTVFGRATPFTDVQVWVHDTEATNLIVSTDGSGNWSADFTGIVDITSSSQGDAAQFDVAGDSTQAPWSVPRFTAAPDDDWVSSNGPWTPGRTVTLTIENGSGVVYTDSQVVDGDGNFNFNFGEGEVFDLQRGHTVTITDGIVTKTHEVLGLHVDTIDVDDDRLLGRADPGSDVEVWVHDTEVNVMVTPDADGNWTADLSGLTDLTYASNGGSQQADDDGDTTGVWWSSPSFVVGPDGDWVESSGRWTPDAPLTVTIEDEFGEVHRDESTVDPDGYFRLEWGGVFDLRRGHTVTVTDGSTTKVHDVFDLYVDTIDVAADTVAGRASPDFDVDAWVHDVEDAYLTVSPDGAGLWSAEFSGLADLTYFSNGGTQQTDLDGDATNVGWQLPRFFVDVDREQIEGNGWEGNAEIQIFVDGIELALDPVVTDPDGNFGLGLDFDFAAGQLVVVTDGTQSKQLRLTAIDVTSDAATDTIGGTATPFAELDVWAAPNRWTEATMRHVAADDLGDWIADFSVPGDGWPALDLDEATVVTVDEFDEDADATRRNLGPPTQANRGVAVTPVDDHVWVANSNTNTVTRLDNDGNVVAVIDVGEQPTGVAVDAAGKVWVTNLGSDSVMRIDPTGGPLGHGAVDLTVDLGEGASPYNYSDMTGAVVVGSTSPQGFWTVVQDSGMAGFEWGRITWNSEPEAFEPDGSAIIVEARTADSEAGLAAVAFTPVVNGELFSSLGRYIEVRVTLKASPDFQSPVLSDIRIQPAVIDVDVDIKPGSDPNSINLRRAKGLVPVAILGSAEFDVLSVDVTSLRFGPDMAEPAHDIARRPDHYTDVDEDGFLDLVSHYRTGDIGLELTTTEACLTGQTLDGIPIEGCDAVRVFWRNR